MNPVSRPFGLTYLGVNGREMAASQEHPSIHI